MFDGCTDVRSSWSPRRDSRSVNNLHCHMQTKHRQIIWGGFPVDFLGNCLRFANPAEAIGGLEAWRFGGLEAWKGLERLGKTWGHGGLGQREVCAGKWVPGGWKIGPWASKMTLGTSKLEANLVPGGQNRGLEGPGTSKIGSWTIWKEVWRARDSCRRPSWRFQQLTWPARPAFLGTLSQ